MTTDYKTEKQISFRERVKAEDSSDSHYKCLPGLCFARFMVPLGFVFVGTEPSFESFMMEHPDGYHLGVRTFLSSFFSNLAERHFDILSQTQMRKLTVGHRLFSFESTTLDSKL
ncbi:hypothetical protein CEXT_13551 [Caerostris extrusa]|uniref:Uncharacterized protein n=1 Tax=Caerostris extrusa TaxID=172846 RepID=A0AAV4YAW8_CAEEX|nr:hypothetical protein CEXT_13551 [Caerostris extrusa]